MPANLRDLRNRIKSISSQQKIVQAMKLVSASKFGRAQNAVIQARPYASSLSRLVERLASSSTGEQDKHPLLKTNDSNTVAVVVISAERGLCGGYNTNVAKMALKTIQELEAEGKNVSVTCIGKKAFQLITRRRKVSQESKAAAGSSALTYISQADYIENPEILVGTAQTALVTTSFEKPTFEQVTDLADALIGLFTSGKISRVVVVYNKFQSAMSQLPSAEELLPLMPAGGDSEPNIGFEPLFEPSPEILMGFMLPRSVVTRLYQIFLEATASEHGARMSAMDSASRNAKELLRRYQITYQRARQAAITRELIEIISGAEAL